MRLDTQPGEFVSFLGKNGWPGDVDRCRAAGLIVGQGYAVRGLDVRQSNSFVQLDGVSGSFNSVCFENCAPTLTSGVDLFGPPDPLQSLVDALPRFPVEIGDEMDDLADALEAYRARLEFLDTQAKNDALTVQQLRALIRAVQAT